MRPASSPGTSRSTMSRSRTGRARRFRAGEHRRWSRARAGERRRTRRSSPRAHRRRCSCAAWRSRAGDLERGERQRVPRSPAAASRMPAKPRRAEIDEADRPCFAAKHVIRAEVAVDDLQRCPSSSPASCGSSTSAAAARAAISATSSPAQGRRARAEQLGACPERSAAGARLDHEGAALVIPRAQDGGEHRAPGAREQLDLAGERGARERLAQRPRDEALADDERAALANERDVEHRPRAEVLDELGPERRGVGHASRASGRPRRVGRRSRPESLARRATSDRSRRRRSPPRHRVVRVDERAERVEVEAVRLEQEAQLAAAKRTSIGGSARDHDARANRRDARRGRRAAPRAKPRGSRPPPRSRPGSCRR